MVIIIPVIYNRIHTGDPMNIPLPCLGTAVQLEKLVDQENIRLVVVAMEQKRTAEAAEKMIQRLSEKDLEIKIIPGYPRYPVRYP